MKPCVCGHARDRHIDTPMSVAIGDPDAPRSGPWQVTYDHEPCHCGCTVYLEDASC